MNEPQKELRKQCSACKDFRLLEEFHIEKKKPLGRQSRCKLCKAAEGKIRRQKEAEDKAANQTNNEGETNA